MNNYEKVNRANSCENLKLDKYKILLDNINRKKNSSLISKNKLHIYQTKRNPNKNLYQSNSYSAFIEEMYIKYSKNLEKYFKNNRYGMRLIGNRLYKNTSIDQYLKERKLYQKKKLSQLKNESFNLNENYNNYSLETKNDLNNDLFYLTPIPNKSRKLLNTNKEKDEFLSAERSAVVIRTFEYTHGLRSDIGIKEYNALIKDKKEKLISYMFESAKKIQNWWKKNFKKYSSFQIKNYNKINTGKIREEYNNFLLKKKFESFADLNRKYLLLKNKFILKKCFNKLRKYANIQYKKIYYLFDWINNLKFCKVSNFEINCYKRFVNKINLNRKYLFTKTNFYYNFEELENKKQISINEQLSKIILIQRYIKNYLNYQQFKKLKENFQKEKGIESTNLINSLNQDNFANFVKYNLQLKNQQFSFTNYGNSDIISENESNEDDNRSNEIYNNIKKNNQSLNDKNNISNKRDKNNFHIYNDYSTNKNNENQFNSSIKGSLNSLNQNNNLNENHFTVPNSKYNLMSHFSDFQNINKTMKKNNNLFPISKQENYRNNSSNEISSYYNCNSNINNQRNINIQDMNKNVNNSPIKNKNNSIIEKTNQILRYDENKSFKSKAILKNNIQNSGSIVMKNIEKNQIINNDYFGENNLIKTNEYNINLLSRSNNILQFDEEKEKDFSKNNKSLKYIKDDLKKDIKNSKKNNNKINKETSIKSLYGNKNETQLIQMKKSIYNIKYHTEKKNKNDNYKLNVNKNEMNQTENQPKNFKSQDNNLININISPDKSNKLFNDNTFNIIKNKKENYKIEEDMINKNSHKKESLSKRKSYFSQNKIRFSFLHSNPYNKGKIDDIFPRSNSLIPNYLFEDMFFNIIYKPIITGTNLITKTRKYYSSINIISNLKNLIKIKKKNENTFEPIIYFEKWKKINQNKKKFYSLIVKIFNKKCLKEKFFLWNKIIKSNQLMSFNYSRTVISISHDRVNQYSQHFNYYGKINKSNNENDFLLIRMILGYRLLKMVFSRGLRHKFLKKLKLRRRKNKSKTYYLNKRNQRFHLELLNLNIKLFYCLNKIFKRKFYERFFYRFLYFSLNNDENIEYDLDNNFSCQLIREGYMKGYFLTLYKILRSRFNYIYVDTGMKFKDFIKIILNMKYENKCVINTK